MLRLRGGAASGAAAPFVAGHIRDLIGAVTAVAADDVILEQPGVKAGRLRAIKADIAAQVCDPRLDIAGVAARAGISPRYVRRLFQDEGSSFSDHVLGERSEEHTSEPQSLMRISYAVFCLKKKIKITIFN